MISNGKFICIRSEGDRKNNRIHYILLSNLREKKVLEIEKLEYFEISI